MEKKIIILVLSLLLLTGCSSGSKEEENNTVCSENNPTGTCETGKICELGVCVFEDKSCSAERPNGECPTGKECNNGICEDIIYECSQEHLTGVCTDETKLCLNGVCVSKSCSVENPNGNCENDLICENGNCVDKAIDLGEFSSFNGKFAQVYHFESITRVFGIDTLSKTDTIMVTTAVQNKNAVNVSTKVCDIDINNVGSQVQITVPNKFITSLDVADYVYTLSIVDGKINIFYPNSKQARGIVFEDIENDSMPEDKNDPRIFDQDEDTKPGMTLVATGLINSEMYIVQRTTTSINGTITSKDTFDGAVVWSDEQKVLGAENPLLNQDMSISPHNEDSYFRSTRIDNSWDCEQVLQNKDTLFNRE